MYNKLFTKILDSSLWLEDHATVRVWFTLLAVMDEDGMCDFASLPNLAYRARVTREEAAHAVALFEGPDEYSADPENEGRRIERVPGGWVVLNARKYRDQVSRTESKRLARERTARWRESKAEKVDVTPKRHTFAPCDASVTAECHETSECDDAVMQSESESESRANTEAKSKTNTPPADASHPSPQGVGSLQTEHVPALPQTRLFQPGAESPSTPPPPQQNALSPPRQNPAETLLLPQGVTPELWHDWLEMRRKIKKPATPKAQQLAISTLCALAEAGESPQAVIEQSILNAWQGLFPVRQPQQGGNHGKPFNRAETAVESAKQSLQAATARIHAGYGPSAHQVGRGDGRTVGPGRGPMLLDGRIAR